MENQWSMLLAADIAPLRAAETYQAAYETVSGLRQHKADRLRWAEDKCLSLGVELLLRMAMARRGLPAEALRFRFGAKGSPTLRDHPDFHFSLCHTGEIALCAAAGYDIGCDAEKKAEAKLRVAQRFFTPKESADVRSQPTAAAQAERFYRYWTLKESFQKITGMGFHLPMRDFEISLGGTEITVSQCVDGKEYRFREYDFLPGYACSVVTAGGACPEPERVDIRDCL